MAITLGDGETRFFDPASFLLVLGGTLTAVLSRRSL
ncbi:MAG: flagellar motor protein PomA, partial [Gammaproteobacteria bacterium]|nr:flagellar motor protein PomA [Gammaproteobacteria bacterium]